MEKKHEKYLCRGSWLSLKNIKYETEAGDHLDWEVITRTRQETVVIVIARLVHSGHYILIRQFRPGIDKVVVSLPAGCVSPGSDISEHALQELKEETGYRGRVISLSPKLKINPAVLDCDLLVATIEVDEKSEENSHPLQDLEPEEEIEVVLIEPDLINDFFQKEIVAGREIDAGCWLAFSLATIPRHSPER